MLRWTHLVQPSALRSHFVLALEQFWQAFCLEVEYRVGFMKKMNIFECFKIFR